MRSRRSVTIAPIFWPSRSLKVAIDFFALVTTGFWPAIARSSSTAESMILGFAMASPRPMLMVIFMSRGTCILFLKLNSFISCRAISLS